MDTDLVLDKTAMRNELFAQEYVKHMSAAKAARAVGYSKKSSYSMGPALYKLPEVQARIAELQEERIERTRIDSDFVLYRLAAIADFDIRSIIRIENGMVAVTDTDTLTKAQALAVSEITSSDNGAVRIKAADKLRALELIGKHLGMFVDRKEVTADVTHHATRQVTDAEADAYAILNRELLLAANTNDDTPDQPLLAAHPDT